MLLKKIAVDFGKAVTAGVVISFGATVFLSNPNRMFTSILFSLISHTVSFLPSHLL